MKKIFLSLFIGLFLFIGQAEAAGLDVFSKLKTAGQESTLRSGGQDQLIRTIGSLINAFLGFLGTIALVIVIYAGYLWLTAGGNEDKVSKAKDLLKNGVIGLVIISLAYTISAFVVSNIVIEAPAPASKSANP